jgi:hypothetical protein
MKILPAWDRLIPTPIAAISAIAAVAAVVLGAAPALAEHNAAEVAKDRCDIQLTFEISRQVGGSVPDSGLDYRRARVTPLSSTRTTVEGLGLYRRDRYDRGRPYSYRCTYNQRTGVTKANYRWTGPALGPEPEGWPGGTGNEPSGPVIFSGTVSSVHSGKVLDVAAGSNYNGAAVIQYTFRGTPNQLWDVIDAGRGRFVFVSQDSNKVLEVRGGGESDGDPVEQFRYNGRAAQLWRIERLGGGAYQIVNVASGKCLDVEGGGRQDGSRIIQYSCQGSDNQAWRLGN